MARGKLSFRQSDVTRAIKAAIAAGIDVARVEIDKEGKIVIVTGKPDPVQNSVDLDRELREWEMSRGQSRTSRYREGNG
jgi:hypothetical protein